jgi:hypothetical protein
MRCCSRSSVLIISLVGYHPHVDQSIARRDRTFFDKNTGALSAYAKGVLIANAAWAAWWTLVRPPAQLVGGFSVSCN